MASVSACRMIDAALLRPSAYNPRTAHPDRLDLVEMSLRTFGFVSPIYATDDGEIISGHQRHLVATERLGWKALPAVVISGLNEDRKRSLNILFNMATNDVAYKDSRAMTPEEAAQLVAHCSALGETPVMAPVLDAVSAAPDDVSPAAQYEYQPAAYNASRALWDKFRIVLPVIVGPQGEMINGIGRLQYARAMGIPAVDVVRLAAQQVEPARLVMNRLTMDYAVNDDYRRMLRYNANRRLITRRSTLGSGFIFAVHKGAAKDFDIQRPEDAARWRAKHGACVVDFGAGHLDETNLLRGIGVDVLPFEPYRTGKNDRVDYDASVELTRAFLARIAEGPDITSVFCSSVMNSVPFAADREHMVQIMAALCLRGARLYSTTMSIKHSGWYASGGGAEFNSRNAERLVTRFPSEDGVNLVDVSRRPKIFKYHRGREFYDLWKTAFDVVQVKKGHSNQLNAIALKPRVDARRLREAIRFEFDLPYEGGRTMGLVPDALAAFGAFTGVKL